MVCSTDWRPLLLIIILFVVLRVELRALCISSTRKPVSHLTGLCKSLRNLRDKPAAALALLRWEVPRRGLERPRRQRLCFPTGQSKTILLTSVFQSYLFV